MADQVEVNNNVAAISNSTSDNTEELAAQFRPELSWPKIEREEMVEGADYRIPPTFKKSWSSPAMQGIPTSGFNNSHDDSEGIINEEEKKKLKQKRPSVAAIYEIPVFKTDNKYDKRPDAGKSYLALKTDDPFGLGDLLLTNYKNKDSNDDSPDRNANNLQSSVGNRRIGAPAMTSNASGFKTHVPGIFNKIQAKLDPSTLLVEEQLSDSEEDDFSDLIFRQKMNKRAQVPVQNQVVSTSEKKTPTPGPLENTNKRVTLSRSSSVLSSDDPVEIADLCLAELAETAPLPTISLGDPDRSTAIDSLPEREVISPPNDIPMDDILLPLPPTLKPKVSAPAMQGNPRGFKTHVPGIFNKIQSKLDTSTKLIEGDSDEENDGFEPGMIFPPKFVKSKSENCFEPSGQKLHDDVIRPETNKPAAPAMIRRVSAPAMQGNPGRGFKTHVPGIFNKIQAKLDSSLVDDSDSDY